MKVRVVLKPFNIDRLEDAIAEAPANRTEQPAREPVRGA